MKLCLSIAPSSVKEARAKLKEARQVTDLIELRIDAISEVDLERLLLRPRPKVIITNRRKSEGGHFGGNAREQLELMTRAMKLGAEYVDIELSWGKQFIERILEAKGRSKVIVSFHDWEKTPDNLPSVHNAIAATGADCIKIVTMAKDIADNRKIFELFPLRRKSHQKLISLCMGEYGQISRILQGIYGGFLTYAPEDEDESTAPGQVTIHDLKRIYRVDSFNKRTRIFGLVGNPVAQSQGIHLHNQVFSKLSVNAVYVNFLVRDLKAFVEAFRERVSGFSVTMPFKQEILPFLNEIEPDAVKLHSVNSVLSKKGKLYGYNTDLPAITELLQARLTPFHKHAVVLGTGATARAMAFAAIKQGLETTVIGRSAEKASSLADSLGCSWDRWNALQTLRPEVLLNGTSVGMASIPESQRQQLIPKTSFRRGMIVFDAVYDPPLTQLLRDAEAAGCSIISGLEFFERQAQLQSNLFLKSVG